MSIAKSHKIKYDEADAKARLLGILGDLSEYRMMNNAVLVAIYVRPEKTRGGLIVDTSEDQFQSKTGLIVKVGSAAFDDADGKWWQGDKPQLHDWVSFKGSSGRELCINDHVCRVFQDTTLDMVVPAPDSVW